VTDEKDRPEKEFAPHVETAEVEDQELDDVAGGYLANPFQRPPRGVGHLPVDMPMYPE